MESLIKIWVYLIKSGKKTIEDVPTQLQAQVEAKL
jgi:hypothetical protein